MYIYLIVKNEQIKAKDASGINVARTVENE